MSDIDQYDDGLSIGVGEDESADQVIMGSKVRFSNDFEWLSGAGDGSPIDPDRVFVVIKIEKILQKWSVDGHPIETQRFLAGAKLPDLDDLNAACPKDEWREKFGKVVGPWAWQYVVYFIDQTTYEVFTYPTNTAGGGIAVRDLRKSTDIARRLRGDNLFPRIRLRDTFMKTGTGGRQRPVLEVVDYISIGGLNPSGAPASNPITNGSGGNGAAQIEASKPIEPKPEMKAEEPKPEAKVDQPKAGQKTVAKAAAVKASKISPARAKSCAS